MQVELLHNLSVRGRVKSEDEFKDARAIGTAAGAEAGAQQSAMRTRRRVMGKKVGGPVARRKAIKAAAERGMSDKSKVAFYRKGGTSTQNTTLRNR